MLGALGITQESLWMIIVVLVAAVLAIVIFAFFASQEPGGLAWKLFRALWYDVMYFFFGPRAVEV